MQQIQWDTLCLHPDTTYYMLLYLSLGPASAMLNLGNHCAGWILPTWHKARPIWQEGILIEEILPLDWMGESVGYCFWTKWLRWDGSDNCGYCHLWSSDPGFFKKVGWPNKEKQSSMQNSSQPLHQCLTPGSCLEFLPLLPSVMNCGLISIKWNKSFPPQVSLAIIFHYSNRNPIAVIG